MGRGGKRCHGVRSWEEWSIGGALKDRRVWRRKKEKGEEVEEKGGEERIAVGEEQKKRGKRRE